MYSMTAFKKSEYFSGVVSKIFMISSMTLNECSVFESVVVSLLAFCSHQPKKKTDSAILCSTNTVSTLSIR